MATATAGWRRWPGGDHDEQQRLAAQRARRRHERELLAAGGVVPIGDVSVAHAPPERDGEGALPVEGPKLLDAPHSASSLEAAGRVLKVQGTTVQEWWCVPGILLLSCRLCFHATDAQTCP